jgi:hypothetical protein
MLDPARTTEKMVMAGQKRPEPEVDIAQPLPPGLQWLIFVCGLAAVVGTAFGFLIHPALHALSGASGLVLVVASLRGGGHGRRRADGSSGLYYQGPVRKTIAG